MFLSSPFNKTVTRVSLFRTFPGPSLAEEGQIAITQSNVVTSYTNINTNENILLFLFLFFFINNISLQNTIFTTLKKHTKTHADLSMHNADI